MATKTGSEETTTPASDAGAQVKAALGTADGNVTENIQTLGLVHQARLAKATRVAASLKSQFGANDARVKAAEASVTATQGTIDRISVVHRELAAPVVQVAASGWALQGYVVDTQYQPMPRFTVFFVDANNDFLSGYGFAYTDDTGYFLINYAGDSRQATTQLFIALVNAEGNPVYRSPTAFVPTPATATFQTIVVPAGDQTLGDPTPAIRAVAFPAQGVPPQSRPDTTKAAKPAKRKPIKPPKPG